MLATNAEWGSEYTTDFTRPLAAAAVKRLDPNLELVFNRRYGIFQVVRWTLLAVRYEVPSIGNLLCLDRFRMWEADVEKKHMIEQEDNPYLLIEDLKRGEIIERPELLDDNERMAAFLDYRAKIEEKVRDEWKHFRRFNRSQIQRLYQPFYDWTGYVR